MGLGVKHYARYSSSPEVRRFPLYGRVGEPQDRSERVQTNFLLSGFEPPTAQAVASRYNDLLSWPVLEHPVITSAVVIMSRKVFCYYLFTEVRVLCY
jgi:hypothetical protein